MGSDVGMVVVVGSKVGIMDGMVEVVGSNVVGEEVGDFDVGIMDGMDVGGSSQAL